MQDRSMEAELLEGTCDGTYKRVVIDRSNYPDPDRRIQRADRMTMFHGTGGYGIAEAPEKRTPDGRFCNDIGFVPPHFPEVTVRVQGSPAGRQAIASDRI
jgi:hypothetical protein